MHASSCSMRGFSYWDKIQRQNLWNDQTHERNHMLRHVYLLLGIMHAVFNKRPLIVQGMLEIFKGFVWGFLLWPYRCYDDCAASPSFVSRSWCRVWCWWVACPNISTGREWTDNFGIRKILIKRRPAVECRRKQFRPLSWTHLVEIIHTIRSIACLLYTSPSPRD